MTRHTHEDNETWETQPLGSVLRIVFFPSKRAIVWHCLELIEYHGMDTKQHAESKERKRYYCVRRGRGKGGNGAKKKQKNSTAGLIMAWF